MKNRPVAIGIGSIQQKETFDNLDEALVLMDKAVKNAIHDSTNNKITNYIDEILVPKGYWKYRDPGKWVAKKNNIESAETSVTKIGILQQNLINSSCARIVNGEIDASLIMGGESRYKMLRAQIEEREYIETELNINPDKYIKAPDELNLDIEKEELGLMAVGYYAILESAFRASLKKNIKTHSEYIAKMYSDFSKVASINDDAWIDNPLEASDINDVSIKNPLMAFPYNKNHCSSWNVNQSCAIIICSEAIADKLKVPFEKRVYPLASSETNYMIPTLQRPNLIEPIGMKLAADFILDICKENNLDVDMYDLYSCFPVAVQMFAKLLNLTNANQMTITGGMPFAGGPLNSFVLHSTTKLISKIREMNKGVGLVTGVSGMMTKQSYALWSKNPNIDFIHKDFTNEAKSKEIPIEISNINEGNGKILGYTIINYDSKPKAVMYINTSDGKRKLITSSDKSIIKLMENKEWVGKKIYFKENQLVF
tara:strand:- start:301 stop:1749 length:1449 start_codon:yes stop_codon:yes gene_type:complete